MDHKVDGDANCNWCTWNDCQRLGKGIERLGNKKAHEEHPDDSINKNGQNTEKSPGDLKRLAVTQTHVKKTIS